MENFKSILPSNSTALEKRIERTIAKRLAALELSFNAVDPISCPVEVLPFLAWAYDAPIWDDAWPAHIKRQYVANLPFIKRHRGTVAAIEVALSSLNVKTRLIEWFNQTPIGERGSFIIRAFVGSRISTGSVLTPKLIEQLKALVNDAKAASRHFDFLIGIEAKAAIGASCAASPPLKCLNTNIVARPNTSARALFGISGAFSKPFKFLNLEMRAA